MKKNCHGCMAVGTYTYILQIIYDLNIIFLKVNLIKYMYIVREPLEIKYVKSKSKCKW